MKRRFHTLKYLTVFTIPGSVALSFSLTGFWTWFPMVYAFVLVPALELLFRPQAKNLAEAEVAVAKADSFYDWLLYLIVPTQWAFLAWFLYTIEDSTLAGWELAGRISAMGLMCGVLGINVAHELGHRSTKHERALAKTLLLSSLYMHFYIEHNRGHHKHVSTPNDPASARKGEILYTFWLRSVINSYRSAWQLERQRLRRKNLPFWSWHNEMLRFQIIQATLLITIGVVFNLWVLAAFVLAAAMGFLLLETVNYIEHYGLQRKLQENGKYERVQAHHSWNSNHVVGRLLLFELSRHSDHHFIASRPYQVLRHHDHSPQMPTGYPGMMLLSLFPPLWMYVMHHHSDLKKHLSPSY